ncbi:hypothetical protein vBAbaMPhT2_212 [Acinetobacter phage vB_AbaM_PhT2]|uniref:Uncharacterized protein n=2 Tax=Hadassahvirus TaxID=2842716 RepID=A0A6B9SZC2_9CAUD|nr:hypothetical protein HYP74_gp233 [Acinetobacter phage AbTZA1]YP_009887223.1 hypothetical protein HYQ24_gp226 [Acinetobacter phage vB_AbaM_PhT2]QQO96326.1 hypothetical protein CPT_Minot_123 [Acinetobacter phage Minot]QQO96574.1 hypothetical protein CPT_Mokit_123 [Acinetobacter phage Mokit]QQO96829.1 hypothetical protein CPT_Melin_128 [Acinetobacter phage Melin]UQS94202.1 hypothetical protein ABNavy71_125 [Acinetobacter phage AB-Navy71]SSU39215.1 Uncharacterised protein [Acinetobacter bauman
MKFKEGENIIIMPFMIPAKVVSFRQTNTVDSVWAKNLDGHEFPMNAIRGTNKYALETYWPHRAMQDVYIVKVSHLVSFFGWIALAILALGLYVK